MNVLLITADSLRADRTSLFGYRRDTTPFLSELAEDSFEFNLAYSNGTNTATSFPSLHTSTYQSVFDGMGLPESDVHTFSQELRSNGYRTFGIHTNELISGDYNYDKGFDTYRDARSQTAEKNSYRSTARKIIGNGSLFELIKRFHFLTTEHLGIKLFNTADSVSGFTSSITDWINNRNGSWFVWVHYMNPHHPYEPPTAEQRALGFDPIPVRRATQLSRKMRRHPEAVTTEEQDTIGKLYDASVLSFDREVAELFEALGDDHLEETLTIVTADHGELLGEDGKYGHPPELYQELLRVPLLVRGGTRARRGFSEDPVDLITLAPTILQEAGMEVPDSFDGPPLFTPEGEMADFSDYQIFAECHGDGSRVCCITDDRKIIYNPQSDDYTYWRLNDTHLNATKIDKQEWDKMESALQSHLRRTERNRRASASVDETTLESDLAALGYLDESSTTG